MKILIMGTDEQRATCEAKLGTGHTYESLPEYADDAIVSGYDVIFDFLIEDDPFQIVRYSDVHSKVFLNSVKVSLAELVNLTDQPVKSTLFGFNGLPGFFNREELEVTLLDQRDQKALDEVCAALGILFRKVADRVGMVTPRVICMIINEAYYTVQEGTATREDIDLAMKLGTNYPYGPFEWTQQIGIRHVYEVLEAVYEDTHDERYKVCPLLKREFLMNVND